MDAVPGSSKDLTGKSKQHCCVPNCTSDSRLDNGLHFHHLPKDPKLRKEWIIKIRRDEGPLFKPSASTVVCSKHFKRDDYKTWGPVRKGLNKGAVPSIFDWSKSKPPRRVIKKHTVPIEDNTDSNVDMETDNTEVEQPSIEDIPEDPAAPDQLTLTKRKIDKLEEELKNQKEETKKWKKQCEIEKFGLSRFSEDRESINFYTGFSSYLTLVTFFKCIEPSARNMTSAYYASSETLSLKGRKRNMLLIDEFFMFLCRLRAGLKEHDLSVRFNFNCSLATVSRKLITWINFLYFTLGSIPIWLPKESIQMLMPDCFKKVYPNTRVVIDCTELKTQHPSSLVINSQTYSNYKGTTTFKALLGIAPHGAISFISKLYTGSMSDVEITKLSGLLDLIEPGDDIMADKGFTLKKILAEKGATLNIPSFLRSRGQFEISEIEKNEEISQLRIHIERMNRRIKENHIFDTEIPLTLAGSANQLWAVACQLANFKGPLVQAWSN